MFDRIKMCLYLLISLRPMTMTSHNAVAKESVPSRLNVRYRPTALHETLTDALAET